MTFFSLCWARIFEYLSWLLNRGLSRLHVFVEENAFILDFEAEHGGAVAIQRMTLNMDTCISHTQPTMYDCSSHATTSILKPRIFSMKMVKHARMLSTQTSTVKTQCWCCGKSKSEKGFLLCPSCNAVQAPDPDVTYFEVFDQDPKFELDLKDLETKYKSLMKRLHPDLTHGKSTEEKEFYAHWSALVTAAYTVLLKPISRATYLG
ncbi:hypothetical protein L7F22_012537 [Adiantum nelumboides]|nr:hypothetical protein [Adiantum nelumboides]